MERTTKSPFSDLSQRNRTRVRLAVVLGAFAAYLGVYRLFGEAAGTGLLALAALPVILAGFFFGLAGAVISFLAAFASNTYLIAESAGIPLYPDAVLRASGLAGSLVLLVVGLGAAWLQQLYAEIRQDASAREDSRRELEDSERRYRTLFENLPVALGITDQRGRLIAYNAEMLRPGGYSAEDIESIETVADLYFDVQDRDQVLRRLVENEEVRNHEVRFKRKDGSPYLGRLTVIPIHYRGTGERLAIVVDITEEAKAREDLQRSERRFRSLIENSRDVVGLLDREGVILEQSSGVRSVLGYAPEELIGTPVFDLVHADDRRPSMELFAEVTTEPGAVRSAQVRLRRKDGGWVWVEATGKNLLEDPDVGAIVVNYRDISHVVQADADLRDRERFLAHLNEITALALAATDLKPSLQILVEALAELLNADACYLTFWDDSTGAPIPMAASGPLRDGYRSMPPPPDETTFTASILSSGATVVIRDVRSSDKAGKTIKERFPNAALLGLPMVAANRKIGALLVGYDDPARLTQREVTLGEQLGAQVALAINKIQLLEETRQRAEQLETLYTLTQSLNELQELKSLLHQIAEIAADLLDADGGAIYLFDPQEQNLVIEVSTADFIPLGTRLEIGEGLAGRVFEAREPLVVDDYGTWEGRAEPYTGLPFRAVMEVPLIYSGEVLGVLAVYQVGESRRKYTEADEHLLSLFASQAAGAVHNTRLYQSLEQSNIELARAYDITLQGWARALDLRDSPTEGHTQRVTEMTLRLARAMGVTGDELDHIRRGALLHDIGKMSIPDQILLKDGPLDEAEWEIMRRHPVYAMEFIRPVDFLQRALDIPYCHHECWDGSGYPRGLRGEEIPLAARIFAIVDAWDALRSERPYREAWPDEAVVRQLRADAGSRYDPAIVHAFIRLLAEQGQAG